MARRPRSVALFALVLALGLGALSGPVLPVTALEQPAGAIRVAENETVTKDFGPIAGQKPIPSLGVAPDLDAPEDCKTATYCDVIPLEVVTPPTLGRSDEFFVAVELSWVTETIPETPATGATTVNDMDLYVWDDPQGDAAIRAGATTTSPETLKLYRPTKGKYQIVVQNYVGPNTGYKLTVSYKAEKIVPPFESLDPGFVPPVVAPTVPVITPPPPVELSPGPEAPALPSPVVVPVFEPVFETPVAPPAPPPAPVPLEPVNVEPDTDFSDFGDSEFDQELAAPPQTVLRERQALAVGPAEPASAGSLLFWLAVVPFLLVAAGGFWLSRKGSAVIRLR